MSTILRSIDAVALDLRKIAHAPHQAVGDARCAACALGQRARAVLVAVDFEQLGAARDDAAPNPTTG